ncbi:transglutaminase domain-containing protein [Clostridium botulinum]|uniref:Transglutaminase n=1 Tax=Clostridium botulinum TaxID=1491 RepID=A0A9Q1UYG6_CLOBO|nr:transglutaminase-like domain-containing protein [Clostridium botulinum]AEB75576.1 transglutaminase-like enzyme, putative cysteine protease [Clostridium botulinum BKT015925]KEH99559.1 transglutaminase [Clostridium botulinum D str. 16868]KEI04305.1 transglutaminase [Clostridium botulinum C/D str. Sp77]KLU75258.1 transglutaminase [Clostridium botulinum V891]KOA76472.1 transglutaminase [Clostridium botulinum]
MNNAINFISENPIDIMLLVIFAYPIIKGFLFKFSSKNLKNDIEDAGSYVSFIIGSILGAYMTKSIFIENNKGIYKTIYDCIPKNIIYLIEGKPIVIYVVCMPIVIFIIYKIIDIIIACINRITFYPLLDGLERLLREKSNFIKRIIGAICQTPKSICFILLATFFLNVFSMLGINQDYSRKLEKSDVYAFVSREFISPITNSNIAKELPKIINNSFKIVVKNDSQESTETNGIGSKTIVYYNGITLNEGLRSNNEINAFAKNLVKDKNSQKSKAKTIYDWIGKNIDYDYKKADSILDNNFAMKSGAINTFYTRKGICFDYACLYAAMGKANGLKVRVITGEGFNGSNWISHAWNQVYVEDEKRWINVDTTFYKGGNYFDSSIFNLDHRQAKIAG